MSDDALPAPQPAASGTATRADERSDDAPSVEAATALLAEVRQRRDPEIGTQSSDADVLATSDVADAEDDRPRNPAQSR